MAKKKINWNKAALTDVGGMAAIGAGAGAMFTQNGYPGVVPMVIGAGLGAGSAIVGTAREAAKKRKEAKGQHDALRAEQFNKGQK